MGERLADVGVVGKHLVVGMDSNVPVGCPTLVVTREDGLELYDSIGIRNLSTSEPCLSIVVPRVSG